MLQSAIPHIFIDASPLVRAHLSGVARYTAGIIKGFDQLAAEDKLSYTLTVPLGAAKSLDKFELKYYKKILTYPVHPKMLRLLNKIDLCPPMDFILGRGNYYFPDFLAWPLTKASYSAVVIHDMAFKTVPETLDSKNRAYLERILPMSIKRAGRIIANSEYTKSQIIKHYPKVDPDLICVVYPAIYKGHFYKRSQKEIDAVKKKYGLGDKGYILSVGNVEPRKNYQNLIDAYTCLHESLTDKYSLVIVGAGGWQSSSLKQKIQAAKDKGYRIILPEKFVIDEDLPALYSGASLFALVSLYEGFGIPVLEALACEARVLASNVTSLPEAGGEAATYTDPTNVSEITQALTNQLLTPALPNFANLAARQVDKFSWHKSAAITVAAVTNQPLENFL